MHRRLGYSFSFPAWTYTVCILPGPGQSLVSQCLWGGSGWLTLSRTPVLSRVLSPGVRQAQLGVCSSLLEVLWTSLVWITKLGFGNVTLRKVGRAPFELKCKPERSGTHLMSLHKAEGCLWRRRGLWHGGPVSHSCEETFLGNERTYLSRLQTCHFSQACRLGVPRGQFSGSRSDS